ncbi:MAG TPA: endonuclease/exonuclease/phosphatase family protein [Solirubrobacterales bacterium]|nr:endonuclease/exonuclease/phosphatase family protein [Solirubrobacterales bacterium]
MPGFEKPDFDFPFEVGKELGALREHKKVRGVPEPSAGRLLLATWNIANLGVQERRVKDYQLLAEIIGWFDLVALQEVNNDLEGLRGIEKELPDRYQTIFSDPGGNEERFAFLYDRAKVTVLDEIGRVTVPPKDLPDINLPGVKGEFKGFDRNPYLVSFQAASLKFVLANVHLYFGKDRPKKDNNEEQQRGIERRCLEAYAVARWADLRHDDDDAYTRNVLALGDFNLPKQDKSDQVFAALTKRGLRLPKYSTKVPGSNLDGDAQYDQMAVFPGPMEGAIKQTGVFDFDDAVFPGLWGDDEEAQNKFQSYVKYYLSDHRPLWAELKV